MSETEEITLLRQALVDCERVALEKANSPWPMLCDCIDNDGNEYQSQMLHDLLMRARGSVAVKRTRETRGDSMTDEELDAIEREADEQLSDPLSTPSADDMARRIHALVAEIRRLRAEITGSVLIPKKSYVEIDLPSDSPDK